MVLKLEKINIFNFKSFKGLHCVSGLDDHFTAIVGPNGSGKSNILDSILFVLGFKAKKMRHAVLKDLINSGCTECYVELVFNDFSLRRSLKGKTDATGLTKNVTSKFELDGREIQSSDAVEFLKKKGIDLENNRFLILQGEIESIAMMSPLELLDYIEDCIGSNLFKADIEAIESICKTKKEELDALLSNLKFIETDFLFKKSRRDNKLELLLFKHTSLHYKNKIVLLKRIIAEKKMQRLISDKMDTENLLNEISIKNKKTMEKIKKLEIEVNELALPAKEAVLERTRAEFRRIERENKFKETKKARVEKSIDKLKKELSDNKYALDNWKNEQESLLKYLDANTKEIKELRKELEVKSKELSSFNEIAQQKKKLESFERSLLQLLNKKDQYTREQEDIQSLQEKLEKIESDLSKMGQIQDFSKQKMALEKEVSSIKKDIDLTHQEINNRKRKAEEFKFLEIAYKKEQEVIDNLKSVQGVFGFLKGLGSYDLQYEQAIEAATKSLNSIVVDTTSTAEKCIEIINKKGLGRTTFIIQDRLANPSEDVDFKDLKSKGINHQLLYKLIKCESQFIKCFYFAFKDTIVTNTLEEARLIAFAKIRRRVVTLDGKLLEKSGIMSGGKVSKKLKSAAELESILHNMESIFNSKKKELDSLLDLEERSRQSFQYKKQSESIKNEIKLKSAKFNTDEMALVNSEIDKIKTNIKALENIKIPSKALDLKGDIQILNEKMHVLDQVNQDIKIKLDSCPEDKTIEIKKQLSKLEAEYSSFEFDVMPDMSSLNQLENEYNTLFSSYKVFEKQITELRNSMGDDYHAEAECRSKLDEIAAKLVECDKIISNCESKRREVYNEFLMTKNLLNHIEPSRVVDLDEDLDHIDQHNEQELKELSKKLIDELSKKEAEHFNKIKEMEKTDHVAVEEDIEIYRMIFSEYEKSKKEYEATKESAEYLNKTLEDNINQLETLKSKRLNQFMEGFSLINKNIKEIFNLITFGGNAELDLIDYLNPFAEGVVLNIMPPKKSWKQISTLSGGEKTLSSLSLIFALHKYKPSCLYIMDEIDAALDFKNVSIISQYLMHVKSQFIIISLRNDMFEKATTLIGVYKTNNESKVITVDLNKLSI